ncbi:O-methyltransferase [Ekhidna sp.]|uniref:O-methyltransferase n=1 Tax=Ekhidna sp. TaxID=2608089 RepID=UPI003B5B5E99
MSKNQSSSYEKINYSLRPGKAIERKIFCEALGKLSHFSNFENYRYIGFGSTYFSDFSLIHRRLGINDLISIEMDSENSERFEFNRPFSCISTIFEHSNDALPRLKWSDPTILWLDYDYKLDRTMLQDINTFFTRAVPGSFFIISLNIRPDESDKLDAKNLKKHRIEKLTHRVGREKLPADINERNLGIKGNIDTIHEIISDQINEILLSRNGLIDEDEEKINFEQIFNIYYRDGVPMLTIGGIIFQSKQRFIFDAAKFDEYPFTRNGAEPFEIIVPSLTFKEIYTLDELLPDQIDMQDGKIKEEAKTNLPTLKPEDIKEYSKIYRYFPRFAEANF